MTQPDSTTQEDHGETVLVVEDDPNVRALSAALLKSFGYETLEAEDGRTALKVLRSEPGVNLLFTDVVLQGGMSGPELAAEVYKRLPQIAVLYTSAYIELAQFDEHIFGKHAELIHKPYRREALAQKVRQALAQARS